MRRVMGASFVDTKFIGLHSLFNRCMNEEGRSGCFVTERAKWSSN